MRTLKYHEKRLLKKVNFLEWKSTNTTREHLVTSRFQLHSRNEYTAYNHIVGMIRKLTDNLAILNDNDHTKISIGKKLLNLLYNVGIIPAKKLSECAKVSVTSFCHRRLPSVMVSRKLVQKIADADKLVQQGHVRVGSRTISESSTLISRSMEEFVTWTDRSKIRQKIDEFNGEQDDYKYV